MGQLNIRLGPELESALRQRAHLESRPMGALVRQAIERELGVDSDADWRAAIERRLSALEAMAMETH